uniref:MD-2-related lipid-recognition domain-containing protein n=1 Tax=Pinctada fucata TaxID=50426 RepID=A0A194AJV5_PINFU
MNKCIQVFAFILLALSVSCFRENEDDIDGRFDERIEIDRHFEMREVIQRRGGRRFDHDQVVSTKSEVPETRLNFNPFLAWLKKFTDPGKMNNCGTSAEKMDVTWTPEVVPKDGSLTVSLDGVAAADLSTANIAATVRMGIFSKTIHKTVTCEQMKQAYSQLTCPIKKGDKLQASGTMDTSKYPLRSGDFELKVTVKNENNEEFACLEGKLKIE